MSELPQYHGTLTGVTPHFTPEWQGCSLPGPELSVVDISWEAYHPQPDNTTLVISFNLIIPLEVSPPT